MPSNTIKPSARKNYQRVNTEQTNSSPKPKFNFKKILSNSFKNFLSQIKKKFFSSTSLISNAKKNNPPVFNFTKITHGISHSNNKLHNGENSKNVETHDSSTLLLKDHNPIFPENPGIIIPEAALLDSTSIPATTEQILIPSKTQLSKKSVFLWNSKTDTPQKNSHQDLNVSDLNSYNHIKNQDISSLNDKSAPDDLNDDSITKIFEVIDKNELENSQKNNSTAKLTLDDDLQSFEVIDKNDLAKPQENNSTEKLPLDNDLQNLAVINKNDLAKPQENNSTEKLPLDNDLQNLAVINKNKLANSKRNNRTEKLTLDDDLQSFEVINKNELKKPHREVIIREFIKNKNFLKFDRFLRDISGKYNSQQQEAASTKELEYIVTNSIKMYSAENKNISTLQFIKEQTKFEEELWQWSIKNDSEVLVHILLQSSLLPKEQDLKRYLETSIKSSSIRVVEAMLPNFLPVDIEPFKKNHEEDIQKNATKELKKTNADINNLVKKKEKLLKKLSDNNKNEFKKGNDNSQDMTKTISGNHRKTILWDAKHIKKLIQNQKINTKIKLIDTQIKKLKEATGKKYYLLNLLTYWICHEQPRFHYDRVKLDVLLSSTEYSKEQDKPNPGLIPFEISKLSLEEALLLKAARLGRAEFVEHLSCPWNTNFLSLEYNDPMNVAIMNYQDSNPGYQKTIEYLWNLESRQYELQELMPFVITHRNFEAFNCVIRLKSDQENLAQLVDNTLEKTLLAYASAEEKREAADKSDKTPKSHNIFLEPFALETLHLKYIAASCIAKSGIHRLQNKSSVFSMEALSKQLKGLAQDPVIKNMVNKITSLEGQHLTEEGLRQEEAKLEKELQLSFALESFSLQKHSSLKHLVESGKISLETPLSLDPSKTVLLHLLSKLSPPASADSSEDVSSNSSNTASNTLSRDWSFFVEDIIHSAPDNLSDETLQSAFQYAIEQKSPLMVQLLQRFTLSDRFKNEILPQLAQEIILFSDEDPNSMDILKGVLEASANPQKIVDAEKNSASRTINQLNYNVFPNLLGNDSENNASEIRQQLSSILKDIKDKAPIDSIIEAIQLCPDAKIAANNTLYQEILKASVLSHNVAIIDTLEQKWSFSVKDFSDALHSLIEEKPRHNDSNYKNTTEYLFNRVYPATQGTDQDPLSYAIQTGNIVAFAAMIMSKTLQKFSIKNMKPPHLINHLNQEIYDFTAPYRAMLSSQESRAASIQALKKDTQSQYPELSEWLQTIPSLNFTRTMQKMLSTLYSKTHKKKEEILTATTSYSP